MRKMHRTPIFITCGALAVVILSIILIAIGVSTGKVDIIPPESGTTPEVTVSTITVDDPVNSGTETEPVDDPIPPESSGKETSDDPGETTEEVSPITIEDEPPAPITTPRETAAPAVEPITTPKVPDDDPVNTEKIPETSEPYNCGTPGHHCDGPETHAYVLNLEREGCPYCHKSDCPSFYATDEWGNTCYTPSKCPQYDIHSDPVYYCQNCGKKCGDGSHGTCVQFVTACHCPNCGKWVESWTCHCCED